MADITHSLSTRIVSGLNTDKRYTESERQVFTYGIELILNSLLKITVYLIIGILFDAERELITALFIFGTLRKFSGGRHAVSNWGCFLITGSILAFSVSVPYVFCVPIQVYPLAAAMIWIIYARFAPCDQYYKSKKEAANLQKKKTLIILSIFFITGYFNNDYYQMLVLCVSLLQGITLIDFKNIRKQMKGENK